MIAPSYNFMYIVSPLGMIYVWPLESLHCSKSDSNSSWGGGGFILDLFLNSWMNEISELPADSYTVQSWGSDP